MRFPYLALREVDFTAASNGSFFLLEVDASAATFIASESTAVGTPLQVDGTIPKANDSGNGAAAKKL